MTEMVSVAVSASELEFGSVARVEARMASCLCRLEHVFWLGLSPEVVSAAWLLSRRWATEALLTPG